MTQGGFPVLTVHDEFIVRRNDRKFLEITVSLVAKQVLERVYAGVWAEVKAKWETSTDKRPSAFGKPTSRIIKKNK
tara:strand:- start:428 stop:655 length:228 start_codon:yes stop_codon:yes gene_type:complete